MRAIFCFVLALLLSCRATAWETDQYTLPAQPIAEVGEEVSRYIYLNLLNSINRAKQHRISYSNRVEQLTTELKELQKKQRHIDKPVLSKTRLNYQIKQLKKQLQHQQQQGVNYYQTPTQMALFIQQHIGVAIAKEEKKDAIWGAVTDFTPYKTGMKAQNPVAFCPRRFDSIYAYAGFHRLLHPSHFVLSSTIKLYGIEVGMDKLGHLFNEGFQYYLRFSEATDSGYTESFALREAVKWGVTSEDSYYGRWVSGIYSNADLASNYTGLYFYRNLFSSLVLAGVTYPAILIKDAEGDYQINDVKQNEPQRLLKRFVSNHMNEAFNSSSFEYLQYIVLKEAVKNRCSAWQKKYPNPAVFNNKLAGLQRWNGADYGYNSTNTISIYDSCFVAKHGLLAKAP